MKAAPRLLRRLKRSWPSAAATSKVSSGKQANSSAAFAAGSVCKPMLSSAISSANWPTPSSAIRGHSRGVMVVRWRAASTKGKSVARPIA
ncbi:MAG: hypothetical protein ABI433_06390 [Burkholderiaceae bacterium]